MGKQKGGRIFYTAQALKTPKDVEFLLGADTIPIPSQTGGQCSIDSLIATLFYADGVRQILWDWVYKNAPGGDIRIPDEDLVLENLRLDAQKMTRVFLLTVAARVLRILESRESTAPVRMASFSPSEETHGTTPSEVCSNLGNTLIRMIRLSLGRGEGAPITLTAPPIAPEARTSLQTYAGSSKWPDRWALLYWLFGEFLLTGDILKKNGTIVMQRVNPDVELVAINMMVLGVASEEAVDISDPNGFAHVISLIRLQNKWYIADNEAGILVEMPMPPEVIPLLEDPAQTYFQVKYMIPPGLSAGFAEYSIRKVADRTVLTKTPMVYMLERDVAPGVRPSYPTTVLREHPRFQTAGGVGRICLFWKKSPFASPAGPAAAGAGPGTAGGKRKTRRKRGRKSRARTRNNLER